MNNNYPPIQEIALFEINAVDEIKSRMDTFALMTALYVTADFKTTLAKVCEARKEAVRNQLYLLALQHHKYLGTEVITHGAVIFLVSGVKWQSLYGIIQSVARSSR